MSDERLTICCVCTGNTCRSPMLAALLAAACERHGVEATVLSAGVAAGNGMAASEHAVTSMAARGLDISSHRSRGLIEVPLADVDLFVCMGEHHAAMLLDAGMPADRVLVVNADQGGVPDPFGGPAELYEQTAAVLEVAADDIAAGLAQSNSPS